MAATLQARRGTPNLVSNSRICLARSSSDMSLHGEMSTCWKALPKLRWATALRDRDVIEALTALARSFETRANPGLHYEPMRPSLAQQALIQELREVIADYDTEGQEMSDLHLHGSDALKALVLVLRLALDRSSGRPLTRGFLDFL